MKRYPAYKLVDQDGYSRRGHPGETQWLPVGTVVRPTGEGDGPCGPGVLHGYVSPEVAVLGNPIHADLRNPQRRLMPALARARAILAGTFPAERYDEPLERKAT